MKIVSINTPAGTSVTYMGASRKTKLKKTSELTVGGVYTLDNAQMFGKDGSLITVIRLREVDGHYPAVDFTEVQDALIDQKSADFIAIDVVGCGGPSKDLIVTLINNTLAVYGFDHVRVNGLSSRGYVEIPELIGMDSLPGNLSCANVNINSIELPTRR